MLVPVPVSDSEGMVSVEKEEGIGFEGERRLGKEEFGMGIDDDRGTVVGGAPGLDADADAHVVAIVDVLGFPRTSTREEGLRLTGESGYLWISSGCIRPFRPMAFNYILLRQLFPHFGARLRT